MPGERGAHYENPPIDTTEGVSDKDILEFVIEHETESRLKGGLSLTNLHWHYEGLLPYFEAECARSGVADLKKVRRMTHYLEKQTGIRGVSEADIIGYMSSAVFRCYTNDAKMRQAGDKTLVDIHDEIELETKAYVNGDYNPVLSRLEDAIEKINADIQRLSEPARFPSGEKQRKEISIKTSLLKHLREARSTLLERYLSE